VNKYICYTRSAAPAVVVCVTSGIIITTTKKRENVESQWHKGHGLFPFPSFLLRHHYRTAAAATTRMLLLLFISLLLFVGNRLSFFFNFVSLPAFSFFLLHPIFCLGRGRQEASAKADKGEPFETKCRVCIARIGKEGGL